VTPIPAPPPRLFTRALREALDGALSPDRVDDVVSTSLARAGLDAVPEEFGAFQHFVQGPFTATLRTMAGAGASETCIDRLSHVLWMASSSLRARAPSPAELATAFDPREDREEGSGLRAVDVPTQPPPSSPAIRVPSPSSLEPRSSEPRRSPTIGRISMSQMRAPTVLEVGASRSPARGPVLVVSLDTSLARELEAELAGQRAVIRIGSSAELVRQMTVLRAQGFSVLIDAALPSVDLSTFAGLSSVLPPSTRVVLWGADERQKKRLVTVFPQASEWLASGSAATPGPLLTER
jgi:hypothetical protein